MVAARNMVLIGAMAGVATIAGLVILEVQRPAWRTAFAFTMVLSGLAVAAAECAYLIWRLRTAPRAAGGPVTAVLLVLGVASAPGFVLGALCVGMILRP